MTRPSVEWCTSSDVSIYNDYRSLCFDVFVSEQNWALDLDDSSSKRIAKKDSDENSDFGVVYFDTQLAAAIRVVGLESAEENTMALFEPLADAILGSTDQVVLITNLCVRKQYRKPKGRGGLGKILVQEALERVNSKYSIVLLSTDHGWRSDFFIKLGFKIVGKTFEFQGHIGVNLLYTL